MTFKSLLTAMWHVPVSHQQRHCDASCLKAAPEALLSFQQEGRASSGGLPAQISRLPGQLAIAMQLKFPLPRPSFLQVRLAVKLAMPLFNSIYTYIYIHHSAREGERERERENENVLVSVYFQTFRLVPTSISGLKPAGLIQHQQAPLHFK